MKILQKLVTYGKSIRLYNNLSNKKFFHNMSSKEIIVTLNDGVRVLRINRPKTKNAFDSNVYTTIASTLNGDANNDDVVVTIITGTGEYYSSGFDIKSAMASMGENAESGLEELRTMIKAFITYPKLLIALVNGPAIGIAVTTAALCDIIYASERATFETPFLRLGLCAEGASSYTFANIMGRSKASEMLLLGKRMSAQEAYQFGFIAEVIPHEKFESFGDELKKLGKKLSVNNVKVNKKLVLNNYKDVLLQCCDRELDQLVECFQSEDFSQAAMQFLSRKSKL